jgi:hypothetical protein
MINGVTSEDIINLWSVERNVTSHGAYTTPGKLYSIRGKVKL